MKRTSRVLWPLFPQLINHGPFPTEPKHSLGSPQLHQHSGQLLPVSLNQHGAHDTSFMFYLSGVQAATSFSILKCFFFFLMLFFFLFLNKMFIPSHSPNLCFIKPVKNKQTKNELSHYVLYNLSFFPIQAIIITIIFNYFWGGI